MPLEISFLRDILGWAMPSWTAGMGEKMSGAVGAAKTKVAQSFSHQNLAEAAKADPATNGGSETTATSAATPASRHRSIRHRSSGKSRARTP